MTHPVHARIDGPLVMIGFGSIGRGTLPLIERHIAYDRSRFTVIEPSGEHAALLARAWHPASAGRADARELSPRCCAGCFLTGGAWSSTCRSMWGRST